MAKIIDSRVESRTVNPSYSIYRPALLGAILGIIFCGITYFLNKYIGLNIASNISTILVATIGIVIMIARRVSRPLVVTIASAVSLWGLASWTSGLGWLEVLIWSAILYSLTYVVYSWITRYVRVIPVLIVTLIIVVFVRIVANL